MLFHKHIYHVTSSLVQTIPPLTHMNIRTMHCKIALTHFQSFDHLITCAILSYLTILTFTEQHSQIYTRDTAKLNAFASHNDRFRSSEFCTSIFFFISFRQQYTIQISLFRLHGYCVASACPPIVKELCITCFQSRMNYFLHTKLWLQSLVTMI